MAETKAFEDIIGGDTFDIRDIIARFKEIEDTAEPESDKADPQEDNDQWAEWQEREEIRELLEEVAGCGGDELWRGDWYPVTFIADSYFEDYARELAEDIGAIDGDAGWPARCIDWEQAADELKQDYSSVEIQGQTYWYR